MHRICGVSAFIRALSYSSVMQASYLTRCSRQHRCDSWCISLGCQSKAEAGVLGSKLCSDRREPGFIVSGLGVVLQVSGVNKTMCSALLRVPKVAMLFLATSGFPHAAMWGTWFQQAGGLLPSDCLTAAVCGAEDGAAQAAALDQVLAACGPSESAPGNLR